jgi:5'-nucleotidase
VDILNYVGLDYAAIGNHEFDNKERTLRRRIEDSKFQWINANAFNTTLIIDQNKDGRETNSTRSFNNVAKHAYFTVNGTYSNVKVGITGGVVDPAKSMARVLNASATIDAIKAECAIMKAAGANIIIALMHQALADDSNLATQVFDIDMVIGGHEHDNYYLVRALRVVPVFRADANARTVYVHDLYYNTTSGDLQIQSRLQHINPGFEEDPVVAERVQYWVDAAFAGFASAGFNASEVIAKLTVPYNVLDLYVRANIAPIGQLVADAMLAYPSVQAVGAEFSLINSGAFRLDDTLDAGNVTQYDVLRLLPFANALQVWNLTTTDLIAALDAGYAADAINTGQFMQPSSNFRNKVGGYYAINGNPLFPNSTKLWTVVSIDFLWNSGTGTTKNLNTTKINLGTWDPVDPANSRQSKGDQRRSVLDYLRSAYPLV